jgi:hypothetical protein
MICFYLDYTTPSSQASSYISSTILPTSTTIASSLITTAPCLITDGMADVNIIPNGNIINSRNISIGDRIRLSDTSSGYVPISSDDKITIKLTQDNSQIAIGQIIISALGFQSASVFIKTISDNTWKLYATLTNNQTSFDNLYATELQFQFIGSVKNIKIGIVGCFSPSGNKINFLKRKILIELLISFNKFISNYRILHYTFIDWYNFSLYS